ncbi:hypothetical protein V6L77_01510 [Pannonibacter sp. Pt2-lr]
MLIGVSPSAYAQAVEQQGRYVGGRLPCGGGGAELRDPEQISASWRLFPCHDRTRRRSRLHLARSLFGLAADRRS